MTNNIRDLIARNYIKIGQALIQTEPVLIQPPPEITTDNAKHDGGIFLGPISPPLQHLYLVKNEMWTAFQKLIQELSNNTNFLEPEFESKTLHSALYYCEFQKIDHLFSTSVEIEYPDIAEGLVRICLTDNWTAVALPTLGANSSIDTLKANLQMNKAFEIPATGSVENPNS